MGALDNLKMFTFNINHITGDKKSDLSRTFLSLVLTLFSISLELRWQALSPTNQTMIEFFR
ncbi:MAG: hypothetical protein ACJAQ4_001521 [Cryomorphaceae bacterium]|jgi:hypothetical protein